MPYTKSGVYYTLSKNSKFAQTQAPKRAVTRGSYAVGRGATYNRPGSAKPMPTETKYFDTSFNWAIGSAADWTGTEAPMTNYVQSDGTTVGAYTDAAIIPSAIGAGYGQINGNKYYIKRIRIKGAVVPTVESDQADVPGPQTCRIVVVEDTQPQGAQAQGEQIFTDLGSAAAVNFSFLAMAAGSGGRFRILKDKIYINQPGSAGTDGASTMSTSRNGQLFKFNINFSKPRQVILKANSAVPTVASLSNCNIFILAHAQGTTTSLIGAARCYYQD